MIEMQHLHRLQELDIQIEAKLAAAAEVDASLGETTELSAARDRMEQLRAHLHQQEQRLHELEWDSDDVNRHISEDEAKLYGGKIKNPKELEGLQKAVEQYRARLREIEDRELNLMSDLELSRDDFQRAQDDLARVTVNWAESQRELSTRQEALAAELAALQAQRAKAAEAIARPILAEYERLRREKKGRAVSRVDRSTCQGCRIALPMGIVSRARAGREMVHCPSCGRLLFA